MKPKNLIIDCDDTLWENNRYFLEAHRKFVGLMEEHEHPKDTADSLLLRLEMENVPRYGYGARSQMMSMKDVYRLLEVFPDPAVLAEIETIGEEVFNHPVSLFPGVEETLSRLHGKYRMFMYTKGNLEEQTGKITKSPIHGFFEGYKVVSEKTPETLGGTLAEFGLEPAETWMIGDSPRSDVMPALELGVRAVYVPYEFTWTLEHAPLPDSEHILTVEGFAGIADHLL